MSGAQWLDLALAAFLAWSLWIGWQRGALVLIADTAAVLVSFWLVLRWAPQLVQQLDAATGWVTASAQAIAAKLPVMPPGTSPSTTAAAISALPLPDALKGLLALPSAAGAGRAGASAAPPAIASQLATWLWTSVIVVFGGWLTGWLLGGAARAVTAALNWTPLSLPLSAAGALLSLAKSALFAGLVLGVVLPVLTLGRPWPMLEESMLMPKLTQFPLWLWHWLTGGIG